MNLKHLTDTCLLNDARIKATEERKLSAEMLFYFREIERRRLYSDMGYGSLSEFLIKDLKYTEAAAGRRIRAARLLESVPEIQKKIESGELSFTNVALAAQFFKKEKIVDVEKKKEILKKLEGKTKLETEIILRECSTEPVETKHLISLGNETMKKLDQLVGLLGNKSLEEAVSKALDVMIAKVEREKFAQTDRPRKPSKQPGGRGISSSVKREVYKRDKACRKCGSTFRLEFDHIKPYSLGGKSTAENIRLLCRSCNQRNRISQKFTRYNPSS